MTLAMERSARFLALGLFAAAVLFFFGIHPVHAATCTWTGLGGDSNWSTAGNWSCTSGTRPVTSSTVVFDSTGTANATINSTNYTGYSGTVAVFQINAGYTGTITVARSSVQSFNVSGAFTQNEAASTFNGATTALTFGSFSLSNGTFTSTSGILQMNGNFTYSGGTFTANSGTVQFNPSSSALAISGAVTFYNLTVASFGTSSSLSFPAGATTTVTNIFRAGTTNNNPIRAVTLKSSSGGVQATLAFTGTVFGLQDVEVQDINNTGTTLNCFIRCTDLTNNSGFVFGEPNVAISNISGDTTEAGGTATFTVTLTGEPTADVILGLTSSDTTEGTVSPSSLTFTGGSGGNWATPQTVTVTGVNDALNDGAITYSIVTAALSSADSRFSGINPRNVTVINDDNDTPADVVDFDNSSDFSQEDVAAELNIGWFEHDYYGHGVLKTTSGGSAVDLTGTKVVPGCAVTVGLDTYTITRVWTGATGEVTVTDASMTDPETLDGTITSDVVGSIHCAESASIGAELHQNFLFNNEFASTASSPSATYDSTDNRIFGDTGSAGVMSSLGGLSSSSLTRGAGAASHIALDTSRDYVWYANKTANTVTVFDATDGSYPLGAHTLGDNTFATCTGPDSAVYDGTNDAIWVLCKTSGVVAKLEELNPGTGASITTVDLETVSGGAFGSVNGGTNSTRGLVYDSTDDTIWAIIQDGQTAVAIDAAAATPKFTTLAASSFLIPGFTSDFNNDSDPVFDASRDQIWVLNAQCHSTYDDSITRIDASTGEVLAQYLVSDCPTSATIDATNDVIYIASGNNGSFTELRLSDGSNVGRHPGNQDSIYGGINVTSNQDVWIGDGFGDSKIRQFVRNGVPTNQYYSMITGGAGEIDSSTWTGITSAAATEELDGGHAYYAVSFDGGDDFKVFTSSAWRTIATNQSSVDGGVDLNWYYIDDSDTWHASPNNSAAGALSYAMANGATKNRTLDSTGLAALTSGNWSAAGGFTAGTLDLGATLFTPDMHSAPVVQSVTFTETTGGGGGGGGGHSVLITPTVAPSNLSIRVNSGASCTTLGNVTLTLAASNVSSVSLVQDGRSDSSSFSFVPDSSSYTIGSDGARVYTMTKPWTLVGADGTVTLIATMSGSGGTEEAQTSIKLDTVSGCASASSGTGSDTGTGTGSTGGGSFFPGEFVRSPSFPTVYYVTPEFTRRPFPNAQTFFTYADNFDQVVWVSDDLLPTLPVDVPMLPKSGVVLVKIQSLVEVYAIEDNPANDHSPLLRYIPDEATAAALYGANWSDDIIDVEPTYWQLFSFGSNMTVNDRPSLSIIKTRQRLSDLQNAQ